MLTIKRDITEIKPKNNTVVESIKENFFRNQLDQFQKIVNFVEILQEKDHCISIMTIKLENLEDGYVKRVILVWENLGTTLRDYNKRSFI